MVTRGLTHKDIRNALKSRKRGFSARSIRRFCSINGIHKPDSAQVDAIVKDAVAEAGLTALSVNGKFYYPVSCTFVTSYS